MKTCPECCTDIDLYDHKLDCGSAMQCRRVVVKFKAVGDKMVKLPRYMTDGAAGADLHAALPLHEGVRVIQPREVSLIPCGFKMELPEGFEAQVRSRSGLAVRYGIAVINAPGTIDWDFRGEVQVALINHSDKPFYVYDGDRIAQMVIAPVIRPSFRVALSVSETDRGDGGMGSTGR